MFETKRYFSRWFETNCWDLAEKRLLAGNPAFCARAYEFSSMLDLNRKEIIDYLRIALNAGYPVEDLLQTLLDEIHEERLERERQLRAEAEKEERIRREKELAIDRKFDELERQLNMLHGGSGRSYAERVIAGELSELDRLRQEDLKNAVKAHISR